MIPIQTKKRNLMKEKTELKQKYIRQLFCALVFIVAISYSSEEFIPGRLQLQKMFFVVIAMVGILGWLYKNINCIRCRYWSVLVLFCLPFVLSTMWTMLLGCINGDMIGTTRQAITTTLFLIVDFFVLIALVLLFGKKVDKVMSFALLGAYAYIIVLKMHEVGVANATKQLLAREIERNDIGIAVVPLLLYYLYILIVKKSKSKLNVALTILLLAVMFFCGKRSAILSIATGIVLILITNYRRKNAMFVMRLLSYITVILSLLYVVCIHIGALNQLLAGKGTLSDRLYVWKYFDSMYEISPIYLGKGFGFIHRYMAAGLGDWMVNEYGYLHNSILQIYIENGFIGFLIWIGMYLVVIPNVAKKKYGESAYIFTVTNMISMVSMFTVDNNLTYPLYQISLYCSLYSLYRFEETGRRGKKVKWVSYRK